MSARLAVFGNPIEHSRSPEIHAAFGKQTGIELTYEKILVPDGQFSDVATDFMQTGTGFNVTVPCKADAWQFVDQASDKASLAQAVNTVSRRPDGSFAGETTDGGGLARDLTNNLGWSLANTKILVVGAGGAVSGVLADLIEANPVSIDLWNRTHEKAIDLAERFGSPLLNAVATSQLGDGYDMIINGTSAGLGGQDVDLPGTVVAMHSRCYDMVYGSDQTQFNRWCLDQTDCTVSDGLGMLVEQAALAFAIWFDVEVETAPVIAQIREKL